MTLNTPKEHNENTLYNLWFLKEPKIIEWISSYYKEELNYKWEWYIVCEAPIESFYPWKCFIKIVRTKSAEHGKEAEYEYIIFDNGELRPLPEKRDWEDRRCARNYSLWKKSPIIKTSRWYMKCNDQLLLSEFEWKPDWYRVYELGIDKWLVVFIERSSCSYNKAYYNIDKDTLVISSITGVPDNMRVNNIYDNIAWVRDGQWEYPYYYQHDSNPQIQKFVFQWLEDGVKEITFDYQKKEFCVLCDNLEYRFPLVWSHILQQIWEAKKPFKNEILDRNGEAIIFSGFVQSWASTVSVSYTKQYIPAWVRIMVDEYHSCYPYDKEWKIGTFDWAQEWWRIIIPEKELKDPKNKNDGMLFLRVKFCEWKKDFVECLVNKVWNTFLYHEWLPIWWVNIKSQELSLITKTLEKYDKKLNDKERDEFMKEWNTKDNIIYKKVSEVQIKTRSCIQRIIDKIQKRL